MIFYKITNEIKEKYNFNENYLNHKFLICENPKLLDIIFKCSICNIKGYFYKWDKLTYVYQEDGAQIDILKLTCEEQQIKNLLE